MQNICVHDAIYVHAVNYVFNVMLCYVYACTFVVIWEKQKENSLSVNQSVSQTFSQEGGSDFEWCVYQDSILSLPLFYMKMFWYWLVPQ